MNKLIVFFLTLVAITHIGFAAGEVTPEMLAKFTPEEKVWLTKGLTAQHVEAALLTMATAVANGEDGKPISDSMVALYTGRLRRYQNYAFFEYDTKISTKWIGNCIAYLDAVNKAKIKLASLEADKKNSAKEYKQWANYYKKVSRQFNSMIKSPGKADSASNKELGKLKKAVVEALLKAEKDSGQTLGKVK